MLQMWLLFSISTTRASPPGVSPTWQQPLQNLKLDPSTALFRAPRDCPVGMRKPAFPQPTTGCVTGGPAAPPHHAPFTPAFAPALPGEDALPQVLAQPASSPHSGLYSNVPASERPFWITLWRTSPAQPSSHTVFQYVTSLLYLAQCWISGAQERAWSWADAQHTAAGWVASPASPFAEKALDTPHRSHMSSEASFSSGSNIVSSGRFSVTLHCILS